MKFYASGPARKSGPPPTLIIEAQAFFDAKQYASRALGVDGLLVQPTEDDAGADVELRWVGSDASKTPTKHLEVRTRVGSLWDEWRKA